MPGSSAERTSAILNDQLEIASTLANGWNKTSPTDVEPRVAVETDDPTDDNRVTPPTAHRTSDTADGSSAEIRTTLDPSEAIILDLDRLTLDETITLTVESDNDKTRSPQLAKSIRFSEETEGSRERLNGVETGTARNSAQAISPVRSAIFADQSEIASSWAIASKESATDVKTRVAVKNDHHADGKRASAETAARTEESDVVESKETCDPSDVITNNMGRLDLNLDQTDFSDDDGDDDQEKGNWNGSKKEKPARRAVEAEVGNERKPVPAKSSTLHTRGLHGVDKPTKITEDGCVLKSMRTNVLPVKPSSSAHHSSSFGCYRQQPHLFDLPGHHERDPVYTQPSAPALVPAGFTRTSWTARDVLMQHNTQSTSATPTGPNLPMKVCIHSDGSAFYQDYTYSSTSGMNPYSYQPIPSQRAIVREQACDVSLGPHHFAAQSSSTDLNGSLPLLGAAEVDNFFQTCSNGVNPSPELGSDRHRHLHQSVVGASDGKGPSVYTRAAANLELMGSEMRSASHSCPQLMNNGSCILAGQEQPTSTTHTTVRTSQMHRGIAAPGDLFNSTTNFCDMQFPGGYHLDNTINQHPPPLSADTRVNDMSFYAMIANPRHQFIDPRNQTINRPVTEGIPAKPVKRRQHVDLPRAQSVLLPTTAATNVCNGASQFGQRSTTFPILPDGVSRLSHTSNYAHVGGNVYGPAREASSVSSDHDRSTPETSIHLGDQYFMIPQAQGVLATTDINEPFLTPPRSNHDLSTDGDSKGYSSDDAFGPIDFADAILNLEASTPTSDDTGESSVRVSELLSSELLSQDVRGVTSSRQIFIDSANGNHSQSLSADNRVDNSFMSTTTQPHQLVDFRTQLPINTTVNGGLPATPSHRGTRSSARSPHTHLTHPATGVVPGIGEGAPALGVGSQVSPFPPSRVVPSAVVVDRRDASIGRASTMPLGFSPMVASGSVNFSADTQLNANGDLQQVSPAADLFLTSSRPNEDFTAIIRHGASTPTRPGIGGSTQRMSQLLPSQVNLLSQDIHGDTQLHQLLIDNADDEQIEELVRQCNQFDVIDKVIHMTNKLQQTPLGLAVIMNKPRIVQLLIEKGSEVNVQIAIRRRENEVHFEQPLHIAASKGLEYLDVLLQLLAHPSIEINAHNSAGHSPLHCAVLNHGRTASRGAKRIDSRETVRQLIERGADVIQRDGSSDKMPLHYAIEQHDVELVQLIIDLALTRSHPSQSAAGGRGDLVATMLKARTGTGNTALHMAASLGSHVRHEDRCSLIRKLLSRGADPSAKNSEQLLPREMTKDPKIIAVLRGQGSAAGMGAKAAR